MIIEDRGGNPEVMALIGKSHLGWKRFIQKGLVGEGISLKQYYLLLQLEENISLQPAQVAALLFCDRPTASVIIRNMEKNGWIRREKDPKNRKFIDLFITPLGREKLEHTRNLPSLTNRFAANPMACFSQEQAKIFLEMLRTFHHHIETTIQEYEDDTS